MEVIDRTHKCSLLPATLVTANVAVYVLLFAAWTFDHDSSLIASGAPSAADAIVDALALPSAFTAWLHRPWTAITYMFTQFSWWHLAGNMIVLYLFAMIADRMVGRSFTLTVYLCGGLAAALLYLLLGALGAASGVLVGSSASVMAMMGAVLVLRPSLRLPLGKFGSPRAVWVICTLVLLDLLGIFAGNIAAHFCHLAGFGSGCAFAAALMHRGTGSPDTANLTAVLEKVKRSGFSSLDEHERSILFIKTKK